jgi:hypothetical protein
MATWKYASAKLITLRALLDVIAPAKGRHWAGGVSGVAEFLFAHWQRQDKDRSQETIRSALAKANGNDELPADYIIGLMDAYQVARDRLALFRDGSASEFERELCRAEALSPTAVSGELVLETEGLDDIWNDDFRTDMAPVQGHPLGIVLELAARTFVHESKWSYGFRQLSIIITPSGTRYPRFVVSPRLRDTVTFGRLQVKKRGVPTREELIVTTVNGEAFDGNYVTEVLGELVKCTPGDRLKIETRAERKEEALAFLGPGAPPSKARQEIICCVFGEERAAPSSQFKGLCSQSLVVTDGTSD